MNLCGFSKTNQGCLYELGLLVDRFPTRRILFLADDTTDMDFLLDTLKHQWDTMPATSPNYIDTPAPMRIYRLSEASHERDNVLKIFFDTALA
jgi:hypothetical protein